MTDEDRADSGECDGRNARNVSASPPDRCPSCGATREAIAKDGHLFLDGWGRPVPSDTPHGKPCPEACSCMPECFSMADHNIFVDINVLIAEARETFLKMVAEDRPFDDAFNNATTEVFAELQLTRELAEARADLLATQEKKAAAAQSFAAEMIAKTILELCEFEDRAQQARADLSRCSRRLALMLAPMFPGEGILASLTVSHDSAVARIKYLVNAEAALRGLLNAVGTDSALARAIDAHGTEETKKALDNAIATIHYDNSARN